MKRILLASHNASLSGAPQVLYNIASHLDRSQFEPLVVFPENGPIIEKFKAAGLPVAVIDVGDSCWEKLHVPMIKALCKAKDISLVHANTIHSYPFVTAAKRSGIPCFLHVHEMLVSGFGISFKSDGAEFNSGIEQATVVGAVSGACEHELLQYCSSSGVSAPRTIVVRNGVLVPETCQTHVREDTIKLLSIGNLAPHKGYHFLIDALSNLKASGHNIFLTVVGDGDFFYLSQLWEQVEKLGLDKNVLFLSAEMDVRSRIEGCDVVVVSSTVENVSMVITEAMAYGKPVVATDVGGTKELLTDKETGLIVPPEKPDALAKAIGTFIEDPEFARRCGEKARAYVSSNFSIQKQVAQVQEIYERLLSAAETHAALAPADNVAEVYALLSEALTAVNEKFHRLDTTIAGNHAQLSRYTSDIVRDLRTLESVVSNLLQKLPFRIYQRLKDLLAKVGLANGP